VALVDGNRSHDAPLLAGREMRQSVDRKLHLDAGYRIPLGRAHADL
jgi:hypothetical protein